MSWTWFWAALLLGFVVIFGVTEIAALRSEEPTQPHHSHTLTATVRSWIGLDPVAPRRWVLVPLVACLFIWLPIHFLTPWL